MNRSTVLALAQQTPSHLTKEQLQTLYYALEDLSQKLAKDHTEKTKILLKHLKDSAESAARSVGATYGSRGTPAAEDARLLGVNTVVHHNCCCEIKQVTAAFERMMKGTYGICIDTNCGGPIPYERLRAMPHAPMDIECTREHERRFPRV